MKKRLLLFCLILLSFLSNAQPTWTFENATWTNNELDGFGGSYKVVIISDTINPDTLINSKLYTKIKGYGATDYFIAIRSDNRKLYGLEPWDTTEFMLYDFNANVGDTVFNIMLGGPGYVWGWGADFYVMEKDSFIINNRNYNILKVQRIGGLESHWIENIGSTEGLMPTLSTMYDYTLECYSNHDTNFYNGFASNFPMPLIPTNGDTISVSYGNACVLASIPEQADREKINIYPNPSTDIFKFEGLKKEDEILVYDITGKMILRKEIIDENFQIDLRNNSSGLYFYRIIGRNKVIQQGKLIKE